MRLVIGGPTRDTVPDLFALDLAHLYALTVQHGPWSSVMMRFFRTTYVHVGREAFLETALAQRATHVLWLDTDMTFPADTAIRLAAHNQPIVACNCVMKTPDVFWTARRHGQPVETTEHSTGLEAVDSVGLAVMLMRTEVVADLPRRWFRHGVNAAGEDIGEDVMFCRDLQARGRTIYVDHELSKEIGHVGTHTYRPRLAEVAV